MFVHTNIHLCFRRFSAHVQALCLIDQLFFGLSNSLTQKQVLGPGWHHDLDVETVLSGRVRKHLPAVGSISQINQAQLIHKLLEFESLAFV
jgi:hypothetical protein